jgi:hypothetical protein
MLAKKCLSAWGRCLARRRKQTCTPFPPPAPMRRPPTLVTSCRIRQKQIYRPPFGGTKHWIVPANMKSNASPVGENSLTILSAGICTHVSLSQAYQVSSGCGPPLFSTLNLVCTVSASPQQYRDLGSTFLSGCRWLSGRCKLSNHALFGPSGHWPRENAAFDKAIKHVAKAAAFSAKRKDIEVLGLATRGGGASIAKHSASTANMGTPRRVISSERRNSDKHVLKRPCILR